MFLFSFLALILLAWNQYVSLWDQDEAAYAGFAKRMIETGNWIIPEFTWSEIHRKPPMHFWLIALSYKIFGINTFAVRFFPALAVWLSTVLIRFWGRYLFGEKVSRWAVLLLAGHVFLLLLGKMAVTDALLLFFYTLAGLSLYDFLRNNRKKSLLIFYIGLALGILVKGPPMLLWAGFFWILLFLFYPDRKKIIRTHPWFWGIPSILPFFLWIYMAWKQNPDFVKWWIDWYILKRTHSAVLGQTGPPGTYFILFFLFGLAYLPLIGLAVVFIWKNVKNSASEIRYLILWFIAGWLPYEFLPSKLPAYVLAAYPALIWLMALAVKSVLNGRLKISKLTAWLQVILFAVLSISSVYLIIKNPVNNRTVIMPIFVLFSVLFLLSVRNLKSVLTQNYNLAVSGYILSGLVWTFGLFVVLLPFIEPYKNAPVRTAKTVATYNKAVPVMVLQNFGHPPSLPFYLEKFNPGKEIVFPDNHEEFLQKHWISTADTIWILAPGQWEMVKKSAQQHFDVNFISALNTGAVGKNDYIVLIPKND